MKEIQEDWSRTESCLLYETECPKVHGKYTNICLTEQGMLPFRREKMGPQGHNTSDQKDKKNEEDNKITETRRGEHQRGARNVK